jgi:SAM-dependent methyltransferase
MMRQEAEWIGQVLYGTDANRFFPLLNVGSSSEYHRRHIQPWIDSNIFAPARERDLGVVHTDLIDAPGVDVVGDLLDPTFLHRLRSMRFRGVLCSNLLEHVTNRQEICDALVEVLEPGGFLIVTVPHHYFLHPDPIDTGFRPNVAELTRHFPGMEPIEARILNCGTHARRMLSDPRRLGKVLARLAVPFYRPRRWLHVLTLNAGWAFRTLRVTCAILRKPDLGDEPPATGQAEQARGEEDGRHG